MSIFTVFGVISVTISLILFFHGLHFQAHSHPVEAIISEISSHVGSDRKHAHKVYVSYEDNGQYYEDIPVNFYSSSMYEGQEFTLLCADDDPADLAYPDATLHLPAFIVGGIGSVFLLIGVISLTVLRINRKKQQALIAAGYALQATVDSIVRNYNIRINGVAPYVVICTYHDPIKDILYRFKSKNLWVNPEPVLSPGQPVRVYVNRSDYSQYYVDAEKALSRKIRDYT